MNFTLIAALVVALAVFAWAVFGLMTDRRTLLQGWPIKRDHDNAPQTMIDLGSSDDVERR